MEENFDKLTIIMNTDMIKKYLDNIQENGYYDVVDVQHYFIDFLLYFQEISAANEIGSYKINKNYIPDIN